MNDADDTGPDEDEPDDLSSGEPMRPGAGPWFGLGLPQGFTRSLTPNITHSMPAVLPRTPNLFENLTQQWSENILGDLRKSLGPALDPEVLRGFQRRLLPPNLRDCVDDVSARQVYDFLQEEGIPLYLVPRGSIAVRLLRAPDHQARRKVLSDRYDAIIEDCESLLDNVEHPIVRDEVLFTLDGVGAMRAGHTRSAQALFTVTLDTLIYRFYPDRETRTKITRRKKGADVPDLIDSMGVHRAFVWLPIWNAHQEFWNDKGDHVPHHYSRHASVHGVSERQFSKRNSIQSLMLVTSLIGYAERLLANSDRP